MRWASKLEEKATTITETLVVSLVETLNQNIYDELYYILR